MAKANRYYSKRDRKKARAAFLESKELREDRIAWRKELKQQARARHWTFRERWRTHNRVCQDFIDHLERHSWQEIFVFLKCGRKFPFQTLEEAEEHRLSLPDSDTSSSYQCRYNSSHWHHGRDGSHEIARLLKPLLDRLVNWRQLRVRQAS